MDDKLAKKFFPTFPEVQHLDEQLLAIGKAVDANDPEGLGLTLDKWCKDKTKLHIDKDRYLTTVIFLTVKDNEASLFRTFLAQGMQKFDFWQTIFKLPDPRSLLKVLLEFVDVNELDRHGRPKWWQCIELENSLALEWLLGHANPDLAIRDRLWKITVLDAAAIAHNARSFRLLTAAGADPALANSLNSSAGQDLMGAETEENDPAIPFMEFLLDEVKVDINEVSHYGSRLSNVMWEDGTALHAAIRSGTQRKGYSPAGAWS